MRILVDISHPAHVHLFRNAIRIWRDRGDQVLTTAREKEVVTALLARYGIPFETLTRQRRGLFGLGLELIQRDWRLWRRARRFRPQFLIGTSPSAAHVSRLVHGTSIFFNDDDRKAVPLVSALAHPFAHWICTPDAIQEDYGPKHIKHPSYHKLAYLHPSRFTPDPRVRAELGVGEGERYFLLRFVSLEAHHDAKARGLPAVTKLQLLELLARYGRVFVSSEAPLTSPFDAHRLPVPPDRFHDVLAFADLVVCDSQTVACEAAVLGTPSLRCNTFVGHLSYLEELEHRYGLTRGFRPEQAGDLFRLAAEWAADAKRRAAFAERRQRMLADKCDLTDWMVRFIDGLAHGQRPRRTA
ncbi:MAG TPA: hypothetical protein PLE19_01390 [Planctomycetota bacterium]|nr:hypothetical protein [Planctomycetota bacterium]HRR78815.1 hypothetical protein [Planctomycetota bacterium]HRT92878.1 hypothetical protein [Planctomycetota bacterium]